MMRLMLRELTSIERVLTDAMIIGAGGLRLVGWWDESPKKSKGIPAEEWNYNNHGNGD